MIPKYHMRYERDVSHVFANLCLTQDEEVFRRKADFRVTGCSTPKPP